MDVEVDAGRRVRSVLEVQKRKQVSLMWLHAAEGVGDSDCRLPAQGRVRRLQGCAVQKCAPQGPDEMELKLQAAHVHAKKLLRSSDPCAKEATKPFLCGMTF